jgi:asparagine synthase (glutamine-hydrolysing)
MAKTAGEWTVGLAHTRLAIVDLSDAGRQPMSNFKGDCWITYNGETYNFQEVHSDLGGRGGPYRSKTDTEVLLRAYETWGDDAFRRLRGMFAFAILDEPRRRVVVARDPFGIKPLYYYQRPDMLVFASEVRALLATGLVPRILSADGLASFLRNGAVQAPATIIEGVHSLLPGHCATVHLDGDHLGIEPEPYAADLFRPGAPLRSNRSEVPRELLALLTDSVRHHLISDVPLGLFLSGGIDSSALVALTKRVTRDRPKTFSVVFNEKDFSESVHARTVAEAFGTDHHEVHLSESRMLDLLPDALSSMDQPTIDGINTFVVSKAVREAGMTVALSGLGSDELFAGYLTFRRAAAMERVGLVPAGVRRQISRAGKAWLNGSVPSTKFWTLIGAKATAWSAYRVSRDLFSEAECRDFLGRAVVEDDSDGFAGVHDPVNAMSCYEMRGYMANTLLRDTDFMSMAHALEVRVPFLDVELARYVLSIPGSWKMSRRMPKPLLVEALDGMLPESVWRRRKMGFTLPFVRWITSELKPQVEHCLSSDEDMRSVGVDGRRARALWARFCQDPSRERWSRPWGLFALSNWCRRHGVAA